MNLKELAMGGGVIMAVACSANVKVEPVEVKPIKVTIDVHVKVDRQLDEFFDFEEEPATEAQPPGTEPEPDEKGA